MKKKSMKMAVTEREIMDNQVILLHVGGLIKALDAFNPQSEGGHVAKNEEKARLLEVREQLRKRIVALRNKLELQTVEHLILNKGEEKRRPVKAQLRLAGV